MSKELLTIQCKNVSNRKLTNYPVTYGVPLAEGVLRSERGLAIRLASGKLLPLQTKALERCRDGSIRWLLLDFELPLAANAKSSVALVQGESVKPRETVKVTNTPQRVTVTTPHLSASFSKKAFSLFESYKVNGREMMAAGSDIVEESPLGKRFYASNAKKLAVRVLESGPIRAVVEVSGRNTAGDGEELLSFRVRYTFRAHAEGVAVAYKFTNLEMPETGVHLASIEVVLPTALGPKTTNLLRQSNTGQHWFSEVREVKENVEVLCGKAPEGLAQSRYGKHGDGLVVVRDLSSFRERLSEYPHYLRPGNLRTDQTGGLRAAYPYIAVNSDEGSLMAFFLWMSFNYPKGLRCDRNVLSFDIWPAWAGNFQLRRGQSKEHELFISLSDKPRKHEAMEGLFFDHELPAYGGEPREPIELTLPADYVRGTQVLQLHRWLRYDDHRYLPVEMKLGSAGAKGDVGNKGILDLGDYMSPDRSWAHNNQDDPMLNRIREYYRREEYSMLSTNLIRAKHTAHVDFVALHPDPLQQGTTPAHCPEHTDGASYPSHMWLDGLMAVYCITGDPDFLDASISIGENMLRWQKDEPTIFYADSRECGWPALAWLRLYEHTGNRKWLDAVQKVFEHLRDSVNEDGVILYELPHGVGVLKSGYGEFIAWRALFFYYELTGKKEVKDFLVRCLDKVYLYKPSQMRGGWACNDLFPAWAAYSLTGNGKYIEDNYPFLRFLMEREGGFPWGGNDMHFYLGELDRRGVLEEYCKKT